MAYIDIGSETDRVCCRSPLSGAMPDRRDAPDLESSSEWTERLAYAFADIDSLLAEEYSKVDEFRTLLVDYVDGEEVDTVPLVESGFQNTVRSSFDLKAQLK